MMGNAFHPAEVHVSVGDSIEWVNEDTHFHTATRLDSPRFDEGVDPRNRSTAVLFDTASGAGGFRYFCRPHASFMKGTIVVE
jgi:plastocyanin